MQIIIIINDSKLFLCMYREEDHIYLLSISRITKSEEREDNRLNLSLSFS